MGFLSFIILDAKHSHDHRNEMILFLKTSSIDLKFGLLLDNFGFIFLHPFHHYSLPDNIDSGQSSQEELC